MLTPPPACLCTTPELKFLRWGCHQKLVHLAEEEEELDEEGQDEAEEQDQQNDEPDGERDPAENGPADDDAEVGYLTEERMDGGGRGAGDDEDEEEDPDFFDADFNPISALQQMSGQRDDGEEQPFHVLAARRRRSVPGTDVRNVPLSIYWSIEEGSPVSPSGHAPV